MHRTAPTRRVAALALIGLVTALSGCAAGPGMVSVPLIGTVPTGGAGNMAITSAATGTSQADLVAQCEIMAQMAVDPAQSAGMRGQMSQAAGMLGCPG